MAQSDSWISITYSDTYSNLDSCAQGCLLHVNEATDCAVKSCVCSGNTGGGNFDQGVTNITSCATNSCNSSQKADEAVKAFRDICFGTSDSTSLSSTITSASPSSTTPKESPDSTTTTPTTDNFIPIKSETSTSILLIKPPKYDNLKPCSKFCLNSCRNVVGASIEGNCTTSNKPLGWDEYRGLSRELSCTNSTCICASDKYNTSLQKLYEAGVKFCDLIVSTPNLPSAESDRLQGALADYCSDNGLPPQGWSLVIEGTDAPTKSGLNQESKVAIIVASVAMILPILSFLFQFKQYRSDRKFRKKWTHVVAEAATRGTMAARRRNPGAANGRRRRQQQP